MGNTANTSKKYHLEKLYIVGVLFLIVGPLNYLANLDLNIIFIVACAVVSGIMLFIMANYLKGLSTYDENYKKSGNLYICQGSLLVINAALYIIWGFEWAPDWLLYVLFAVILLTGVTNIAGTYFMTKGTWDISQVKTAKAHKPINFKPVFIIFAILILTNVILIVVGGMIALDNPTFWAWAIIIGGLLAAIFQMVIGFMLCEASGRFGSDVEKAVKKHWAAGPSDKAGVGKAGQKK